MKGEYEHRVSGIASIKIVIALLSIIGLIFVFSLVRNTLAQAPGDANNDGMINVLDIVTTANEILGMATAPGDPDCNMDGVVNVLDIVCIANIILSGAPTPMTHDVSIGDNFFDPQDLTVNVGDTVRWTNNGNLNHTTTSSEGPGAIWNSDDEFPMPTGMQPGDVFEFTFTSEGTFPYFCEFHGTPAGFGQAGTVIVTP